MAPPAPPPTPPSAPPRASVRVYVGGLPADARVQELRERFGRFVGAAASCRLTDVQLPQPKAAGPFAGAPRGFAYLTLQGAGAEEQSEKLQKTFNRTKWRGCVLKAQAARPRVEQRLQLERREQQSRTQQARARREQQQLLINTPAAADELQPLKVAVEFKGRRTTRFPQLHEQEEKEKEEKEKEEKEQVQEEKEQVKEEKEQVQEEKQQVEQETDVETSEEEQEQEESEGEESEEEEEEDVDVLGEEDVEAFVRQMEEEAANGVGTGEEDVGEKKELTKEEANARRLAALEAKQQRKKEEKVAIPAAGEPVANKKITFDDSGNEQEPEEVAEEGAGVISNWMDSSDDEEDAEAGRAGRKTFDFTDAGDADAEAEAADAEAQAAFALRPEFVGEKGKKLFEMQKRFGGDSRFRLDARFLEEEANEYGGNDVDEEEEQEVDEEATAELQNFLDEENPEEAARHAREMREEEAAALRVVAKLFPDVDVTRLQRRMQEQRAPKDPLKEAAWMGELKRYDPRDAHACREFEIPMTTGLSGAQKSEEEAIAAPKREEKEIPTGGDRFFATTGDLSNLFSRVRKNSEDGEEGEAALDGVFGFGAAANETSSEVPFKLSSLFSFPVGEDKPLAAMGEQLLEDEQEEAAPGWAFSHPTDDHEDEAMATDSEAGDDVQEEEDTAAQTKKRVKKSLEDFLAFGRTFIGGEAVEDWPERRKKLTLDYKRKRRDAVKMKKRQNKQQNKASKAKTEAAGSGTSKWKKARL
ncbi:uncharacterized protein IUM83_19534 [Phytophthora cinnamomi]|uniref:uncharacterized protein n=1 Tax=Phytophthora cinnamomi TaxID=4785 RepID=UPI00355A5CD3|nr:hypothetical protein IUM83_19534 [Phytophthora cinnamomi]